MAENWTSIAAEVAAAIAEVGFVATLTRTSAAANEPQNPWSAPASPANAATVFTIRVIDDRIKDFYQPGGLLARQARVLTIATGVVVPTKADIITVRGERHVIAVVRPEIAGGVDLMYECEIAA